MKKKTRQVKARPIAAREQFDSALDDNGIRWQPIWTLPRTPEAWDAMEEAGAKAIHDADRGRIIRARWDADYYKAIRFMYRKQSRAFLTALSLVRPTQKGGT